MWQGERPGGLLRLPLSLHGQSPRLAADLPCRANGQRNFPGELRPIHDSRTRVSVVAFARGTEGYQGGTKGLPPRARLDGRGACLL